MSWVREPNYTLVLVRRSKDTKQLKQKAAKSVKIYVLNYQLAREFVPTEPTIMIRIYDPDDDSEQGNNPHSSKNRLVESDHWKHILEYTFEDIDLTAYEGEEHEATRRRLEERPIFTQEIAEDLVSHFAHAMLVDARGIFGLNINTLVVHCNAGISRSVAVTHALVKRFGIEPEWQGRRTQGLMGCSKDKYKDYVGNKWVYKLILEV